MTVPALNDKSQQSLDWRMRIISAIVRREFDDESLVEMLIAGFHQAHSEGLHDAAHICREVAKKESARFVASRLERAILELDSLNKKDCNKR